MTLKWDHWLRKHLEEFKMLWSQLLEGRRSENERLNIGKYPRDRRPMCNRKYLFLLILKCFAWYIQTVKEASSNAMSNFDFRWINSRKFKDFFFCTYLNYSTIKSFSRILKSLKFSTSRKFKFSQKKSPPLEK